MAVLLLLHALGWTPRCAPPRLAFTASDAAALPTEPSADLTAEDVLRAVFYGLQFNDFPDVNSGLKRCYEFMDPSCIHLIMARPKAEDRTLHKFVDAAAKSPKLSSFIGAKSIAFGALTTVEATPTRGELVSCAIRVVADASPDTFSLSGLPRRADASQVYDLPEEVATFFDEEDGSFGRVAQDRPEKNFAIRLQRQRYPPFLLLTDIIDTAVVSSNRKLNRE